MAETSKSGGNVWSWVFGIMTVVFIAFTVILFILWRKEKKKNADMNKKTPPGGPGSTLTANLAINNPPAVTTPGVISQNEPATSIG